MKGLQRNVVDKSEQQAVLNKPGVREKVLTASKSKAEQAHCFSQITQEKIKKRMIRIRRDKKAFCKKSNEALREVCQK